MVQPVLLRVRLCLLRRDRQLQSAQQSAAGLHHRRQRGAGRERPNIRMGDDGHRDGERLPLALGRVRHDGLQLGPHQLHRNRRLQPKQQCLVPHGRVRCQKRNGGYLAFPRRQHHGRGHEPDRNGVCSGRQRGRRHPLSQPGKRRHGRMDDRDHGNQPQPVPQRIARPLRDAQPWHQ